MEFGHSFVTAERQRRYPEAAFCGASVPRVPYVHFLNTTVGVTIDMDDLTGSDFPGPFETRYVAFLETVSRGTRHPII